MFTSHRNLLAIAKSSIGHPFLRGIIRMTIEWAVIGRMYLLGQSWSSSCLRLSYKAALSYFRVYAYTRRTDRGLSEIVAYDTAFVVLTETMRELDLSEVFDLYRETNRQFSLFRSALHVGEHASQVRRCYQYCSPNARSRTMYCAVVFQILTITGDLNPTKPMTWKCT